MINPSSVEDEGDSPVKALRELLNMSQEAFARLLGISVKTVWRWEKGIAEPTFNLRQYRTLEQKLIEAGYSLSILPDSLLPGNHLLLGG